ncbi:MAG TPA: hypothetical protein VEX38_01185 [Fimbriimonadaceae bacterium]|nr:hypothetical protein [Fimbriimonadaceae bacterium]
MRRALLLSVLLLSGSAFAQKADLSTPEKTVTGFVSAVRTGKLNLATQYVKGGKATTTFREMEQSSRSTPLKISNLRISSKGANAIATFDLTVGAGNPKSFKNDSLKLVKVPAGWQIVPSAPSQGSNLSLASLAMYLTNPKIAEKARGASKSTVCLSNIKQLAVAVMMLMGDNDDTLALNGSNWQQKVMPYLQNKQLFICPESGGKTAYSFNGNLAGRKGTSIPNAKRTVLLYEGSGGKLNFRHNGKAAVAFADGHAKLIDKKEAATLLWK